MRTAAQQRKRRRSSLLIEPMGLISADEQSYYKDKMSKRKDTIRGV